MNRILFFFDKLEDKIRGVLSRYPIVYATLGGIAIVLFWRGVWVIADDINLSGVHSLIVAMIILLTTGLFVSFFIGDNFLLAGLRQEKKLTEKNMEEVRREGVKLSEIKLELDEIKKELHDLTKNTRA
jgi:hypothetical protein